MKRLIVVAVVALLLLSALHATASPEKARELAAIALRTAGEIEKPDAQSLAMDEALIALSLIDTTKAKSLIPEGQDPSDLLGNLLSDKGCPELDSDLIPFFLIVGRKDPVAAFVRFESAELSDKSELMALAALAAGANLAGNKEVVAQCSRLVEDHGSKVESWLDGYGDDDSGTFSLTCWLLNQVSTDLTTKFARRLIANSVEDPMSLARINLQCQVITAMAVSPKSVKALVDEIKPIVSKLVKGDPKEDDAIGENYSDALNVSKAFTLVTAMLKKIEQALIKPASKDDREIRDAMLEAVPDQLVKMLSGLVVFKNWRFLGEPARSQDLMRLSLEMAKKSDWPSKPYSDIALAMSIYDLDSALDVAKKITDPGVKSETYANLAHIAYFEGSPVLIYRLSERFGLLAGGASMTFD